MISRYNTIFSTNAPACLLKYLAKTMSADAIWTHIWTSDPNQLPLNCQLHQRNAVECMHGPRKLNIAGLSQCELDFVWREYRHENNVTLR